MTEDPRNVAAGNEQPAAGYQAPPEVDEVDAEKEDGDEYRYHYQGGRTSPAPVSMDPYGEDDSFDVESYEDEIGEVTWTPPNKPGAPALRGDIRLYVLSGAHIARFQAAVRNAKTDVQRRATLKDEYARIPDPDNPDLPAPVLNRITAIREELERLRNIPDDADLMIGEIILPVLVRWNAKSQGVPIPIEHKAIKELLPWPALQGFNTAIIKAVNEGAVPKKDQRPTKHLQHGSKRKGR